MLEQFVNAAIEKYIQTKYPHLIMPSVLNAKITKATDTGTFAESKVEVLAAPWGSGETVVKKKLYEYSLKVINEDGENDETFPTIPKVKSFEEYQSGDIVSVAMAYGKANVQIVGKVG